MAITLNKVPADVVLSRNPVHYRVTTDKQVTNAGTVAVARVIFTDWPAEDETIIFQWDSGNIDFTMAASLDPDETGLAFQMRQGGESLIAYVSGRLLAAFKAVYYLSRDFKIEYELVSGEPAVKFTAREVGTKYIQTITGDAWFTLGSATAGVDKVINENLLIICRLTIAGIGLLPLIYHKPSDNTTNFDLQTYLDAYFNKNDPDLDENTIELCSDLTKTFQAEFVEFFIDENNFNKLYSDDEKICVKGGIKRVHFMDLQEDFIENYLKTETQFLSWRGNKREVTKKQQEWLYFFNYTGTTQTLKRKITIYYTDASTATQTITKTNVPINSIIRVPVGFEQCELDEISPAKQVDYWEAEMLNASNSVISSKITYKAVEDNFLDEYFMFENSLGAFETLRAFGTMEKIIETDKEQLEITSLPDGDDAYDKETSEIIMKNRGYLEILEKETGIVAREELNVLIDFILSGNIFWLKNGKKIPVNSIKGKYSLERSDDIYKLTFSIPKAYQEINHSDSL